MKSVVDRTVHAERWAHEYDGLAIYGWFAPRGLATIVFAILVLDAKLPGNNTIMLAAGWTVVLGVIARGVTPTLSLRRSGRAVLHPEK